MTFRKLNIRFVDSYNFLLQPLKSLPATYDIKDDEGELLGKGYFPHVFNTPENQDYVGNIPLPVTFGDRNMMDKDHKAFHKWYAFYKWKALSRGYDKWNFKEEMAKYCKMDVEILSKCILKFRKLFIDSLDVDPFRYVTLSSLCMSVYVNMFMPDKMIVGNATNKNVSLFSKEWLTWLEDEDITPEIPIYVDIDKLAKFDRHKGKVEGEIKVDDSDDDNSDAGIGDAAAHDYYK